MPASPGQLPMPLAASMDDEKDVSGELEKFKGQVLIMCPLVVCVCVFVFVCDCE